MIDYIPVPVNTTNIRYHLGRRIIPPSFEDDIVNEGYKFSDEVFDGICNTLGDEVESIYFDGANWSLKCTIIYKKNSINTKIEILRTILNDQIDWKINITKTMALLGQIYSHTNTIKIKEKQEEEYLSIPDGINKTIELVFMPFLIFLLEEVESNEFWNNLNIFVSETIPIPHYEIPPISEFRIKSLPTCDDFVCLDKILEEDFTNYYDSSFSNILGLDCANEEYQKYIDSYKSDLDMFISISLEMYKKTKYLLYKDNYIIAKYKQGVVVEDEVVARCLSAIDNYRENNIISDYLLDGNFMCIFDGLSNTLKQDVHLFSNKAISFMNVFDLLILLSDIEKNYNEIKKELERLKNNNKYYKDDVMGIKFLLDLAEYGPGIPNSVRYMPNSVYKDEPLKREIYNCLTILKNTNEIPDYNYYNKAKDIFESLCGDDNFLLNEQNLSDYDLFNLGLYFYIFNKLDMAKDIFMSLFSKDFNKLGCATMILKIHIINCDTNLPQEIIGFLPKQSLLSDKEIDKIESIDDVYAVAYRQLRNGVDIEEIKQSLKFNYDLIKKEN